MVRSRQLARQGRLAKPHRRLVVMPVEAKDALGLMLQFGTLIISMITLVVSLILAITHNKK